MFDVLMGSPTDSFPTKVSVVAGQALAVLVLIARCTSAKKPSRNFWEKRYVLLRQRSWKVHGTLKGHIAKSWRKREKACQP